MSKQSKGNTFQAWVCKFLQARGWSVYNQTPVTRMVMIGGRKIWCKAHKDIFGSDLIAVKQDEKVLFIQATLDGHVEKREAEFNNYNYPSSASVQLWYKRADGQVMISVMNGGKLENLAYIRRGKFVVVNTWVMCCGHPMFVAPTKKCGASSSSGPSTVPQSS